MFDVHTYIGYIIFINKLEHVVLVCKCSIMSFITQTRVV